MRVSSACGMVATLWLGATAFAAGEPKIDRSRQLFVDACTACHTLERVRAQRLTGDQWRGTIAGMISEGMALTDNETDLIVEYLASNFGPGNP